MKRSVVFMLSAICFVSIVISMGCRDRQKQKQKKTESASVKADEEYDINRLKDQIVILVEDFETELKDKQHLFFREKPLRGDGFYDDLILPVSESEKMLTFSQKSYGMGIYSMDAIYASAYERKDKMLELDAIMRKLSGQLNLDADIMEDEEKVARLKNNISNKDSVEHFIYGYATNLNSHLKKAYQVDAFAYMFLGWHVESMYNLVNLTDRTTDKSEYLALLSDRDGFVKHIVEFMVLLDKDPYINKVYFQFKPVEELYAKGYIAESDIPEMLLIMKATRESMIK